MNPFKGLKDICEIVNKLNTDPYADLENIEHVSNFVIDLAKAISAVIRWCYANPVLTCIIAIIIVGIVIAVCLSNRKWSKPMH